MSNNIFYFDEEGNEYKDCDPCGVDVSGRRRIVRTGKTRQPPTPSPKEQPEGQKSITVEDIQRAYCAGYINGAGENGSVIDAMADGKIKDAWERYCNSLYMPAEPTPALQGEIPEEITAAEILHKHMLLGRKNSYMHDAMEEYAQYKCDLLYHKMQEEIREYRKAMERIRDELGMNTTANHVIHMHAIVKEILAKYPHS